MSMSILDTPMVPMKFERFAMVLFNVDDLGGRGDDFMLDTTGGFQLILIVFDKFVLDVDDRLCFLLRGGF